MGVSGHNRSASAPTCKTAETSWVIRNRRIPAGRSSANMAARPEGDATNTGRTPSRILPGIGTQVDIIPPVVALWSSAFGRWSSVFGRKAVGGWPLAGVGLSPIYKQWRAKGLPGDFFAIRDSRSQRRTKQPQFLFAAQCHRGGHWRPVVWIRYRRDRRHHRCCPTGI